MFRRALIPAQFATDFGSLRCFTLRSVTTMKGKIIGVYDSKSDEKPNFTQTGRKYDEKLSGRLTDILKSSGQPLKKGKSRIFYGLEQDTILAVVGLGNPDVGFNELEELDEKKELIRKGLAVGVSALRGTDVESIDVDSCGDQEASAEAVFLSAWCYHDLKSEKYQKKQLTLGLLDEVESDLWKRGRIASESQNLARRLKETPANLMTPTIFAKEAREILSPLGVSVEAHDRKWAESKGMWSFLSVSNGSDQPPVFLELTYNGAKDSGDRAVALVGKGITFDSGGISLKPSSKMSVMRGDMGGAACVFGIIHAAAQLKIPLNIKGLIPLTENLISGSATKPGDVVHAANGKTIQIDNTDAEGRLVLADALWYADTFRPRLVIDLATLTGAVKMALGSSAAAVYSNSKALWELLHEASTKTGDRLWRMPLWQHFTAQVTNPHTADLNNLGKFEGIGGSCTAAAFLQEFTEAPIWAHLDLSGVREMVDELPYICKGMSGRPVRTIVHFLLALQDSKLGLE